MDRTQRCSRQLSRLGQGTGANPNQNGEVVWENGGIGIRLTWILNAR